MYPACDVISVTAEIVPRAASKSARTIVVDGSGGMEAQPANEMKETSETIETVKR